MEKQKGKIDSFEKWKETRKIKENKDNGTRKNTSGTNNYNPTYKNSVKKDDSRFDHSFTNPKEAFKRQILETRKQMLESLKILEEKFDTYVPEVENISMNLSKPDTQVKEQVTTRDIHNTSELYRKISELETLVKKLSIERDMWRFKAEQAIDPNLSLSTTIMNMNEDEFSDSVVNQHDNLDKINFN